MAGVRTARRGLASAVVAGSVIAAIGSGSGAARGATDEEPRAPRPNIVVVMSDDQTLDSMRYMPRTVARVAGAGATFPTSVTNWPICCPSRATFLTGQYVHNHRVFGNSEPRGGFDALDSSETLPVWLERAGYYTAHIGKFLNGYERSAVGVPPGWSEWHGSKTTYNFYGYTLLEDEALVTYGTTSEDPDAPAQPETYSTDVYTDKAVELIGRRAAAEQPFFLSVAYLPPHSGGPNPGVENRSRCHNTAKPAARHFGSLESEPLPQPPNFDEANVSDKPAFIAGRARMSVSQIARANRNYRCRAESLLAIDEGVERIVNALRSAGELANTLLIYVSDNGYFHGEHRIVNGKNRVYEEGIRVPLVMRGPGIPRGIELEELSINADLAPTILDAARAANPIAIDGISLLKAIRHPDRLRGRELLIEQSPGDPSDFDEEEDLTGVFYKAIRNARYTWVEHTTGERELYDLRADPFQLENLADRDPAYRKVERALVKRLRRLRDCSGADCRKGPALELELPRSDRQRGRSCRRPEKFRVRIRGAGHDGVVSAEFSVAGHATRVDRAEPFVKKLPRRRLARARGRIEIRAVAELIDGRVASLQRKTRICRR